MPDFPTHLVLPPDFVPDPLPPAVPPKDAATVMLLRDGQAGLEVFLLRRVAQMAFAGGMTVYPGGGVDRADADASVAWAGPEPDWWARRFRCDVPLARALVCAAVRETFEESGVLLAGPDPGSVVEDAGRYADARAALVARELSLARFLSEARLVLRADLLRPWANWVTPAGERRRYDARFMLAEVPAGQHADGHTSEAVEAAWCRPADALADRAAGRRWLMPPTWFTLAELAELDSVAGALAAAERQPLDKITPLLVRTGGELHLTFPGDPRYRPEAAS
ncbi:MAG TPA: NUDIX hydrolase [Pseudonocardiaceae bacterium]|nr:NUDIX hydrolase [Pseudonocardiaceae bacterium]